MFSYIVSGVILVYNEIIIIVLSVFAVFGAYSVIREFFILLCKKEQLVVAIKITDVPNERSMLERIETAEEYITEHYIFEKHPVFICDSFDSTWGDISKFDVYVKYTEE